MGAIGLNPIRLDRIGLDPIRINAIKLGVPGAASDRPYIDPEVLASLKVVCICYGKSNDDPDRAVVKNLVDPDNPFVISNAAFKLNSGFGKYEITFQYFPYIENVTNVSDSKVVFGIGGQLLIPYSAITENIPSFKIKVSGLSGTYHFRYYYRSSDGVQHSIDMAQDGYYELPICYNVQSSSDGTNCGFANNGNDVVTITQIPSFEGAFVTDGIGDLITSTKTAQEMLGGSNEITVISMIHQIADRGSTYPNIYNNQIRYSTRLLRSTVTAANVVGKTGIYGYTATGVSITGTPTGKVVNDILGDKNDYPYLASAFTGIDAESHFSVEGYLSDSGNINETSKVAWYWTIIANKVLTTDQINQVIAYFNLDRTLKSDIYCNIAKQGITNENHAEFGDKLIDFSGNGRDIQLNNIAWDGDSGIGKYSYPGWKLTANKAGKYRNIRIYQTLNGTYTAKFEGVTELYNRVGIGLEILSKNKYISIKEDGIYSVDPVEDATELQVRFGNYTDTELYDCDITITQIPSHAGALRLDGVDDFGKVTGMPVYKDYTFIIDRQIISIGDTAGVVASKSEDSTDVNKQGAFLFEYLAAPDKISTWSFYKDNGQVANTDFTRGISYQSTYSYNGKDLTIGTSKDSDKLWLGTIRDNDSRFFNGAIYSLMSFPYSMSEFLIERQLKKHKLGTLYPDMVEFRPIVKSNLPYSSISYSVNPGEYISVDSMVTITVTLPNTSDKLMEVSCNAISDISISGDNGVYEITGKIVKSPQKINMIISSYLTMLNNETLISNETLIKNE